MISYRPFRNTDPPALAELWCHQPPHRALAQPISASILEYQVFGKPYFDRLGLIVAEEDGRILGFAHAGFTCNLDGSQVCVDFGGICLLMLAAHPQRREIAAELLRLAEAYLWQHGTRVLFAGTLCPTNPFYLGLYGGSQPPGVLGSEPELRELYRQAGYEEVGRYPVLQRTLADFRPLVDREQMQVRRQYRVEVRPNPPTESWWDACTIGQTERTQHKLYARSGGPACGSVTFWEMDQISASWGVRAMGLMKLEIVSELRGRGLGTFLVGEALRHMHSCGTTLVEAHAPAENATVLTVFHRLGFRQVDEAVVFRRSAPPPGTGASSHMALPMSPHP
jgi:ribosomal protein S18 acetylase RimI-like enzyme